MKYDNITYCLKCKEDITLTNQQFFATSAKGITNDIRSLNMSLYPTEYFKSFFKGINEINPV